MDDKLQIRLEEAFPPSTDAEVKRGVSEGIYLADDLIKSTPILKTDVGRDLRGHVRRAGVMFRLHALCERGDLPFAASMVKMPHGHWHWLEMRSGQYKAHICRTQGVYDFPEDTLSRQDARLGNVQDLFSEKVISLDEVAGRLRELYAWLAYGIDRKGELTHLCWAMPPADAGDWLAHIDLSKRKTTEDAKAPPAESGRTEPPSTVIKLRFKEHIEEVLEKKEKDDKDA